MSSDTSLERFAESCRTSYDQMTVATRGRVALAVMDAVTCMAETADSRLLLQTVGAAEKMAPNAPLAMDRVAMVLGVAAAAGYRGDTHPGSGTHPGSMVIPAVAGVQELWDSDQAAVAAILAGYECCARFGSALLSSNARTILRPSAMVGPVAAALAAALAMGRDLTTASSAMALAIHRSIGFNAGNSIGSDDAVLHSGYAAQAGVDSALLASAGVQASMSSFDGRYGVFAALQASDRAHLVHQPRSEPAIHQVLFKPAGVCLFAQTPAALAVEISKASASIYRKIDTIEVHLAAQGLAVPGCDNIGPFPNAALAQQSIQFGVAAGLVAGDMNSISAINYPSEIVEALASRCKLVADDTFTATFPECQGARLVVRTTDGATVSRERENFQPLEAIDVVRRFNQRDQGRMPRCLRVHVARLSQLAMSVPLI